MVRLVDNTDKEVPMGKRKDYIGWDDYFMGISLLSAQRSKDPSTQVGACIVNTDKKIVGVGYNGFPKGCDDDVLPWAREGTFLETKYPFVCHAELNAILNSISRDLSGCSIYVALFPCNECAKAIIQSGIREIIYLSDKYAETDIVKASKMMLDQAGVQYRRMEPSHKKITLDLDIRE
jgi:dCMP deaminase